jgi:hypothetical protein
VSRTLLARGEANPTGRARFRLIPISSCHDPVDTGTAGQP